jgi:hypothetical protein
MKLLLLCRVAKIPSLLRTWDFQDNWDKLVP